MSMDNHEACRLSGWAAEVLDGWEKHPMAYAPLQALEAKARSRVAEAALRVLGAATNVDGYFWGLLAMHGGGIDEIRNDLRHKRARHGEFTDYGLDREAHDYGLDREANEVWRRKLIELIEQDPRDLAAIIATFTQSEIFEVRAYLEGLDVRAEA
jgi:hypothetical protein